MSHVHHPFTFFGLLVSGVSLTAAPAPAAAARHLRTPPDNFELLNRYRAEMAERAQAQRFASAATPAHGACAPLAKASQA